MIFFSKTTGCISGVNGLKGTRKMTYQYNKVETNGYICQEDLEIIPCYTYLRYF